MQNIKISRINTHHWLKSRWIVSQQLLKSISFWVVSASRKPPYWIDLCNLLFLLFFIIIQTKTFCYIFHSSSSSTLILTEFTIRIKYNLWKKDDRRSLVTARMEHHIFHCPHLTEIFTSWKLVACLAYNKNQVFSKMSEKNKKNFLSKLFIITERV